MYADTDFPEFHQAGRAAAEKDLKPGESQDSKEVRWAFYTMV
jgi:hypothetical protein